MNRVMNKILLLMLFILICGCSSVRYGDIEYKRFGNQKIGKFKLVIKPDKTIEMILENQKAEVKTAETLLNLSEIIKKTWEDLKEN